MKIETDELAKFDYDDDYFNQYYNGPEIPELDIPFRLIHKNIVEIVKSKRDLENNWTFFKNVLKCSYGFQRPIR